MLIDRVSQVVVTLAMFLEMLNPCPHPIARPALQLFTGLVSYLGVRNAQTARERRDAVALFDIAGAAAVLNAGLNFLNPEGAMPPGCL